MKLTDQIHKLLLKLVQNKEFVIDDFVEENLPTTKSNEKNINFSSKPNVQKTENSEELEEFLRNNHADTKDVPQVDNVPVESILANMQKDDHNVLNKVLLEILSPQLSANEIQKRKFKQEIMKYIKGILVGQLIFVAIPITACFLVILLNFHTSNMYVVKLTETIFEFLRYYITAIIVEFIAMLFFIVKYVFDKSIVDLMDGMLNKNIRNK